MRIIVIFLLCATFGARAEVSNSICRADGNAICSKTFYGGGNCNGHDQLPILEEPWERRPIRITGALISLQFAQQKFLDRITGKIISSFAFAGNSSSPDVMTTLIGGGTTSSPHFPSGKYFTFPGKTGVDDPHVDLHVQCSPVGHYYNSYLTIFYKFDKTINRPDPF